MLEHLKPLDEWLATAGDEVLDMVRRVEGDPVASYHRFASLLAKLAQPIDYADLESRGVISKAGTWYRVHAALPEHATCKICEIEQGPEGLKVKFRRVKD
jgi:hypothetical protein